MTQHKIELAIPSVSVGYRVLIGAGILTTVGETVRAVAPHDRAAVVIDEQLRETHGAVVVQSMKRAGYQLTVCAMVGSEARKTLGTVRELYGEFRRGRLERRSPVLAVGGGVVGDTAGFAAASYLRGVPFINVPTTLLAMVDAAVGGKTGVNLELGAGGIGKNLIGAFHQPRAVLIDPQTLTTLPARQGRSGMAECVKHALLGDAALFAELESVEGPFAEWSVEEQGRFIARNVAIKAAIVERDVHEANLRMQLNLGHTFAHVLEPRAELDLFHGEAVGLGMLAATVAGMALEKTDPAILPRLARVLGRLGLPTRCANLPGNEELIRAMGTDKKVADGRVRLIVPLAVGQVEIVEAVPTAVLAAAWDYLR